MEAENLWECPDCKAIVRATNKSQHRRTQKHTRALAKQASRKGPKRKKQNKKKSKVKRVRVRK